MSFIKWLKNEEPGIIKKIVFVITHNFDNGAYGEYLTEYLFSNGNIDGYYKILHNIYVPYKGKTSETDVLLIHEKGIFVFESKNYSGWIFGSENQQQWTQMLNKKTKNKFYNPIKQNITHINALSEYLQLDKTYFKSFIVFSERCELKKVPDDTESFKILRRHHLLKEVRKQLKNSKEILTQEQVQSIYETLVPLTNVSDETKKQHVDRIKNEFSKE